MKAAVLLNMKYPNAVDLINVSVEKVLNSYLVEHFLQGKVGPPSFFARLEPATPDFFLPTGKMSITAMTFKSHTLRGRNKTINVSYPIIV